MSNPGDDGRLPVIHVCGFAVGGFSINNAVDDPSYGFSQGFVHVRPTAVAVPGSISLNRLCCV
ncbi:hypothetical protein SAMN05444745_11136 [Arthrobacter sp. OV608]|nr:hypothetical protein SAMN05444745_11136 [Arthrobacter sp. OV608]